MIATPKRRGKAQTIFRLEPEMKLALKMLSVRSGESMQDRLSRLVRDELERERLLPAPARRPPR